ncbi:hypothetical protein Tco_0596415 [Tanacetum coccineum]
MRMEQYLQCIDYTLWEIIENGNAPIVTKLVDGKKTAIPLISAIESIFGGNTATKKTQKNILKQQYENFVASSTNVIEKAYERLQKLIGQLEMHGEFISQEDFNKKFLRSLSQEWAMHTIGTQESRQQEQRAYKKDCASMKKLTLNAYVLRCEMALAMI